MGHLSCMDVTQGVAARLMFGLHGLLAVLLAVLVTDNYWNWFLATTILLVVAEGYASIKVYKKYWNWAVPYIFIYLCMVVPALLLVEHTLETLDNKQIYMMSKPEDLQRDSNGINSVEIHNMSLSENITIENNYSGVNIESAELWLRMQLATLCTEESGCNWEDTVQVYKQSFIFVLIIGCWLDPMTILNKDEKSQLLLINIGVASDVLEFLEMAKDVRKKLDPSLIDAPFLLPTTLAIWTWSLLQFTLIFKPNHFQRAVTLGPTLLKKRLFANTACWEVLFTLLLMDIPYLVFRLLMIFHFSVVNNSIIFFASKNTLMIIIQFYRIFAVQIEARAAILKSETTESWRHMVHRSAARRYNDKERDIDQPDPETPETLLENDNKSWSNDNIVSNGSGISATKRLSVLISSIATTDSYDTLHQDSTLQDSTLQDSTLHDSTLHDSPLQDSTLTQRLKDDTRSIHSSTDFVNDDR